MKKYFICFSVVISINASSFAQELELENFKNEIQFYIQFINRKFDSLPVNQSNQVKLRKQVDDVFKKFVLHPNSNEYDKLIVSKGDERKKFVRLDGWGEVILKTFPANNKTYVVYSYTSRDKKNYFIKENESNRIVYEGNSTIPYIDNLYFLDSTHMLLIEENGDMHSSRSAMVLSTKKVPWIKVKAFEGNAFGQVPGEYSNKKFVKRRFTFELECDMEVKMLAPQDANAIHFDPRTKILSYKQYTDSRNFKLITAKWENEVFIIDDYDVSENMPRGGVAFPE